MQKLPKFKHTGLEELEAALDAFNKANESIQMWEPDYSTAILVEKVPVTS